MGVIPLVPAHTNRVDLSRRLFGNSCFRHALPRQFRRIEVVAGRVTRESAGVGEQLPVSFGTVTVLALNPTTYYSVFSQCQEKRL